MLIDTHCHLNFKAFENNLDTVLETAVRSDVLNIIVPGAKLDSSQKAINLANKYSQIYAATGIHPVYADKFYKTPVNQLKKSLQKLTSNKKVVAIGECGLDYYHINNDNLTKKLVIKKQIQIFKIQIKLAEEVGLPLIIHNRQASNDIIKVLNENEKILTNNFVFHCFEGQEKIWNYSKNKPGVFIGINALITYKKTLQKIINNIPLEKLVLETDSPFLLPKLDKQKFSFPNTPSNVKIVARYIAKIKNISFKKVANITSKNAQKLFKIKK